MTPTEKALREALERIVASARTCRDPAEHSLLATDVAAAALLAHGHALAAPGPGALEAVVFRIRAADGSGWYRAHRPDSHRLYRAPVSFDDRGEWVTRSAAESCLAKSANDPPLIEAEIVEVPTYRSPEEPAPR